MSDDPHDRDSSAEDVERARSSGPVAHEHGLEEPTDPKDALTDSDFENEPTRVSAPHTDLRYMTDPDATVFPEGHQLDASGPVPPSGPPSGPPPRAQSGPLHLPESGPHTAPREQYGSGQTDSGQNQQPIFAGRYQIEATLGEGAMGRVYRALDTQTQQRVALKLLLPALSAVENLRQRFLREAQLISSFSHPNTVRLYEFGESDGHLFIVMEYVEGVSLESLVARGSVGLPFAIAVLEQIAGSLAEAHAAGVVHRDVKPENIMLTRAPDNSMQAKLLDFGIAHISSSADDDQPTLKNLTMQGSIMGTPQYMSPEQARANPVSPASDVYALGIILYELSSGTLPFVGRTALETCFMHTDSPPPPLQERAPGLPAAIVVLTEKCLEKAPQDRPATAAEFRTALMHAQRAAGLPGLRPLVGAPLPDALAISARLQPDTDRTRAIATAPPQKTFIQPATSQSHMQPVQTDKTNRYVMALVAMLIIGLIIATVVLGIFG